MRADVYSFCPMTEEPAPPPDVPPHLALVAQSPNSAQLDRWALALLALNIAHQILPLSNGNGGLVVRQHDATRATETLHAVEEEESHRADAAATERPPEKLPSWALWFTQLLALALLGFSIAAGTRGAHTFMMEAGKMDALAVLEGGWHRLFTGVTLHADGAHLMGNLAFLMVVAPTVVHRLGPGVATFALVFTGAAGNVVTAGYHGAHFGNVGASGGIFGLLCLLGILAARTRRNRLGGNRWVLGVGAGLALLSMLGFGEDSDVVAHVAGFASAVPLGLWMPLKPRDDVPAWWWMMQLVLGATAAGTVALAWWLALHG
jgi:membrane associated rhomboid family serine protease